MSRDSGDSTKKIDKSVSGQLQSCQEEEQDMSRYVKGPKGKPDQEKVETSEKDLPWERDAKEKETSIYLNKVKTDNGFGIHVIWLRSYWLSLLLLPPPGLPGLYLYLLGYIHWGYPPN